MRFGILTCGTNQNITTVDKPRPVRSALSLAFLNPRNLPVLRLNDARRLSNTNSDTPPGRYTKRNFTRHKRSMSPGVGGFLPLYRGTLGVG